MKKEISEKNFELICWFLSGILWLLVGRVPFALLMWVIALARKKEN